jgi:hypothetical protein
MILIRAISFITAEICPELYLYIIKIKAYSSTVALILSCKGFSDKADLYKRLAWNWEVMPTDDTT